MAQTIYCWQCGQSMQSDSVFCQKCGASVTPGATPVAAPASVPVPQVSMPVVVAYQPYGGFWIRVLAHIIDGLVIGVAFIPIWFIFGVRIIRQFQQMGPSGPDEFDPEQFLPLLRFFNVIWLFALIVQWLYEALLTSSSWQATIGKRALGLKVTDEAGNRISFGRASARFVAKLISNFTLLVGYIMVAFTQRKQGLHDMIAGTLVMKTNPPPINLPPG